MIKRILIAVVFVIVMSAATVAFWVCATLLFVAMGIVALLELAVHAVRSIRWR